MALIDEIERLGAAWEAGMPKDQAVQLLMEYSDGGLTRRGAQDSIENWRTGRAEYQRVFDQSRDALRRLKP